MKWITIGMAVAAFAAGSATAQMHNHGNHETAPPTLSQASAAPLAEGEVRKVDRAAGKITIKHGPIKSIDMPPMTMVFQVKDRTLLDKVKDGEKVRFAAEEKGGAYIVTAIEPAK
jgi:Cu(I)/Ag(I) efflux system periplasmic protein CusF